MARPTKLTSALPLVALAALAGITYWLLQATLPPAQTPERPKEHAPDYFATNFSVSELDTTGTTQYRLTAISMVHYEDDENSDLMKPAMRMFQPLRPTVTATSERGTVNGDVSIVDLYAFSMTFCFSFSSGVIWRSGDKLIPGIGIWAEAAPVSKAIIAPTWTIFPSMSLLKLTMPQNMPHSASFASRIGLLLSVILLLIAIILQKL